MMNTTHTNFRAILAIIALAIGGFGIGCNEYAAMGLLPEITRDLLADTYKVSPDAALGAASWFVSAYALGVVVGAPTLVAFIMRFSQKRVLIALATAFAVSSILTAFAPNLQFAVVSRFIAGLPHGAYFGLASLVAAHLMGGKGKRGAGVAYVLAGLTVANIVGVPLVTWLGQHISWRLSMLTIAGIFAMCAVSVALTVPFSPGNKTATVRNEVAIFKKPMLWLAVTIPAIGNAGFFAVYSYLSPITTDIAGLNLANVPGVLATVGVGMTIGVLIGGRIADINAPRAMFAMLCLLIITSAAVFFLSDNPIMLHITLLLFAVCSSASTPPAQVWIMDVARGSQVLAGSLVHGAFNMANALGAASAGLLVGIGAGLKSPLFAGMLFPAIGLSLLGLVFFKRWHRIEIAE